MLYASKLLTLYSSSKCNEIYASCCHVQITGLLGPFIMSFRTDAGADCDNFTVPQFSTTAFLGPELCRTTTLYKARFALKPDHTQKCQEFRASGTILTLITIPVISFIRAVSIERGMACISARIHSVQFNYTNIKKWPRSRHTMLAFKALHGWIQVLLSLFEAELRQVTHAVTFLAMS